MEDFLPKVKTRGKKKAKKSKKAEWKPSGDFDLPFKPAERLDEKYLITD